MTTSANPRVPDITIVTPARNQAFLLAGAIDNVRSQLGVRVQHIVVDGGSTDGTVELLRSHGNAITWVSEADAGQAHAINKGVAMADGALVGWLNCDDRLTPGALALVARLFSEDPHLEFLYGDALAVDAAGRAYGLRAHVRQCEQRDLVEDGDPIVQPAAFLTRDLWRRTGGLDEQFTYAFDYEFWMRAAAATKLHYVPVCLAVECLHGQAKTSRGSLVRIAEIKEVALRHGGADVPRAFRAEAAAMESMAAVKSLIRGKAREARTRAQVAMTLRPSMWRYGAHALALTVPGTQTVPRLRLIANRVRSKRTPVYPSQLDVVAPNTTPDAENRGTGGVSEWVR